MGYARYGQDSRGWEKYQSCDQSSVFLILGKLLGTLKCWFRKLEAVFQKARSEGRTAQAAIDPAKQREEQVVAEHAILFLCGHCGGRTYIVAHQHITRRHCEAVKQTAWVKMAVPKHNNANETSHHRVPSAMGRYQVPARDCAHLEVGPWQRWQAMGACIACVIALPGTTNPS